MLSGGDIYQALARSGHELQDINTIMEYIGTCLLTNIKAGRLLGGYDNPKAKIFPSRISVFVTPENTQQVDSIMKELFNTSRVNLTDSHLKEFVPVLFAVQLRSLSKYIEKFGEDKLVSKIFAVARKWGCKKDVVLVIFCLYHVYA